MVRSHFAAALALASCVAAEVPAFCNGPACRGSGPLAPSARSAGGLAPRMVAQDYLAGLQVVAAGREDAGVVPAWTAPAGYMPHASQVEPAPAAAETSSVGKWAAPVGYAPMRAAQSADQAGVARSMVQAWCAPGGREPSASMSAPPVEDAEAVMARVKEMMLAKACTSAPLTAPSAPARHRQIFGGYDPKSRIKSAPAQLYQASAMPLTCEVADAPRLTAPAAKPEPKDTASVPTTESVSMETHLAVESASGAPAKTWQPYGGYVPRSRKPEEAVQDTLSASDAQREMDVLASIKSEFLARLDAAGARAAGEHTLPHTRARMSMCHARQVSGPLEREDVCGAENVDARCLLHMAFCAYRW